MGLSPGLLVTGIYLHRHRPGQLSPSAGRGWPPARGLRPLAAPRGARIGSGARARIVVRLRARPGTAGRGGYAALELRYHDATDGYTATIAHRLVVCVGRSAGHCAATP